MFPLLMATINGRLLSKNNRIATSISCCCLTNCCTFIGRTIYARACITANSGLGNDCNCAGGATPPDFVESDFILTWISANNRWEGSFAVGACGTSLGVRLTYELVAGSTGECNFKWSDDACSGDWSTPVIVDAPTECVSSCSPYIFAKSLGGSNERYRSCCPGGTWNAGEGPQFQVYGFCTAAERTCDP